MQQPIAMVSAIAASCLDGPVRLLAAANSNGACDIPGACPCRGDRCPMEQRGGSRYGPGQFAAQIEALIAQ